MTEQNAPAPELTPEEKVQYKDIGKVGFMTLNNPKKRNAIDMSMVARILDILKQVDNDPKIKCLVIKSTGDQTFCAGWDLTMFQQVNQTLIDNLLNIGATISRTIYFLKKPVIMQIQGPAVGMGSIMSLVADFRICAKRDDLFFQLPELDLGPGIPAATGPTVGAVNLLGVAHAKDMLLTGRKISLAEFDKWGVVTQIVDPATELDEEVKKFARKLSSKNGNLLTFTKQTINMMSLPTAKECWELENEMARFHFDGMMGKPQGDFDEFLKHLWAKYGKGTP
jgi:enoyl-CoA hydratase/carnithine racemase